MYEGTRGEGGGVQFVSMEDGEGTHFALVHVFGGGGPALRGR